MSPISLDFRTRRSRLCLGVRRIWISNSNAICFWFLKSMKTWICYFFYFNHSSSYRWMIFKIYILRGDYPSQGKAYGKEMQTRVKTGYYIWYKDENQYFKTLECFIAILCTNDICSSVCESELHSDKTRSCTRCSSKFYSSSDLPGDGGVLQYNPIGS